MKKVFCATDGDIENGIEWEDVIDKNGNFIVTVSTVAKGVKDFCLDIAKYSEIPDVIMEQDDDGGWSIYKNKNKLFDDDIAEMIAMLNKKIGKNYQYVTDGKEFENYFK